eukprot:3507078-Karenia_brevis.AAC.1
MPTDACSKSCTHGRYECCPGIKIVARMPRYNMGDVYYGLPRPYMHHPCLHNLEGTVACVVAPG